ncbi:phosphoribosylanthranilate isomerase [Salinithrix halophila]|uniref:N-(5'-phosphoribosyl)anthranilate isomerase n=1 Tax=Salinithrix halophila TaxID=1485204 RepID=A0ABV8JGG6_9BACL
MRTTVKICGLRRPEDVEGLAGLDLDAAGFILVPGRKRTVSMKTASDLVKRLPRGIASIGVMMDPSEEEVDRWLSAVSFDRIQLHGEESAVFCRRLKERFHLPIIKVFHIGQKGPVDTPEEYAPWVDGVLLDSSVGDRRGGTGRPFDWEAIPTVRQQWKKVGVPVWVAGGLHPGNVGELLMRYAPDGVDTSSGVETAGKKQRDRMAQFVERVRQYDRQTSLG